jgi:type II restriction enzyme
MTAAYKKRISQLIRSLDLGIDPDVQVSGRPPTMANSEFLTNKEQGDWAERIVQSAINENDLGLLAVQHGRSNRWIQRFGVKHYYLQVFFDKACSPVGQKILSREVRKYGDKLDKFEPHDLNKALVPLPQRFSRISEVKTKVACIGQDGAISELQRLFDDLMA